MTPAELACLHARCFTTPRPWTAAEFTELLDAQGCFLLVSPAVPHGFLLGRIIADEAELLTLAVAPQMRRAGLGRELVDRFHRHLRDQRVAHAFLEVASDNLAAQQLYAAAGWRKAGLRRDYYASGLDALILVLDPGAG